MIHEYSQQDGCKINLIVKPIATAYEPCQLSQLAILKLYNRMKAKIKSLQITKPEYGQLQSSAL